MDMAFAPGTPGAGSVARRGFGRLAAFAAVYTYALIVVGGIVRISGSGLGCGDDWPRCHGHWIPPFTFNTVIEYTHRLLAAGIVLVIGAVVVRALRHRREPGFAGPDGLLRPALLAAGLLVAQVLLGALTVKLELTSAAVTALHLANAMALLGTLIVAAVRGGSFGAARVSGGLHAAGETPAPRLAGTMQMAAGERARDARRVWRTAAAGAGLAFVVVAFGALVANTGAPPGGAPSAAALACQGFPFCNGRLLPAGGGLVDLQFTHRLLAYLLVLQALAGAILAGRRAADAAVRRAGLAALGVVALQVAIAAGMVGMGFPPTFRAAHVAAGTAVWGAFALWAALARQARRMAASWQHGPLAAARPGAA